MANGESRIKIKLKGYDPRVLDSSVKSIVDVGARTGSQVVGPVLLPTKIKKYAVNKSPHIYKTSQEHFEMRIHRRLVILIDPTAQTVQALQNLQVPAGVDITLK